MTDLHFFPTDDLIESSGVLYYRSVWPDLRVAPDLSTRDRDEERYAANMAYILEPIAHRMTA